VHILTKIFVVLVSLLAIFMVPLVVVSTLNQEHWRAEALGGQTQLRVARNALSQQHAQALAASALLNEEMAVYSQREKAQLAQIESLNTAVMDAETDLLATRSQLASREATERAIAQSLETSASLSQLLIGSLDSLRSRTLVAERNAVESDEHLAQAVAQLQSAQDVTKVLREENQSLKQDKQLATEKLDKFARLGSLDDRADQARSEGISPDRFLMSTVLNVWRDDSGLDDSTLVEINAGSRDGVREGWIMTVGDGGGAFIGRLRIISVDLNRSTGLLELEDPARGMAEPGNHAYALEGDEG